MITKAELVTMDERFINILAQDGNWTLWKHSPYITIARDEHGESEVIGHKSLSEVKDMITTFVEQGSETCVNEIWDLKKRVRVPFKVTISVKIGK